MDFFLPKKLFFSNFFYFWFRLYINFHILYSKNNNTFHIFIYNCVCIAYSLFFAFQNTKNRKNWIFLCLLCAHSKKFYETTLWCYVVLQKIFHDVLIRSGYLKFCSKKTFPEKKAIPPKFREKKFWKKSKNPNIWPIGRNRPNIFGGQICGY